MKTSLIAVLIGFVVACSSAGSGSSEVSDMGGLNGVRIVARGNLERQSPGAQVLRSEEQLSAVLGEMGQQDLLRSGPLRAVSFDSQVVVAAFLGRRRTGGYGLELADVERSGDFVTLYLREQRPAADAMVTQAITWPAVLLLVDDAPPGVRAFIRD